MIRRVFTTVLLTAAIILAPQAAQAACGFSVNGDYICDGGGNEAKGKTKPARSFTAPKTTKPSPGTYKPLPGMGGSGIDYQAELKKIKDQIEADKKRLEDAVNAPPHGSSGGPGCAQPGVPGEGTIHHVGPGGSLNAAIARLQPGDTLIVAAGTYAESISASAFNGKNDVKIIGDGGAKWTIRPQAGGCSNGAAILLHNDSGIEMSDFIVDASNCGTGIRFDGASTDNWLHDFEVKNWRGSGSNAQGISFDAGVDPLSDGNRISNAWVHATDPPPGDHLAHCIYVTGSNNIVETSVIEGCYGHGIHQYVTSGGSHANDGNTYRYNTIRGNGSFCIGIYSGSNNEVHGNLCEGNGGIIGNGGIRVGSGDHNNIHGNVIQNNDGYCLVAGSKTSGTSFSDNSCWQNGNNGLLDEGTGTVDNNPVVTAPPDTSGVGPAAGCE